MLKKILFVALAFSLTNCLVLNPVGATIDREKGTEVASKITDAAIQTDLINSTILVGRPFISIYSLVAADIAKIESDKYYIKADVDQCISDIKGFKGFVFGSAIANILSCQDLKTDGYLTGEPFPSF
ncbi:TIGR04452 family lipoprotein [Leptospira bandrabouensis]|uniref:TIGR04452 family lipoprotein n=1 Tax=Leptospira bandrabouensis TaxID=2484903 RepID=A0A6H3NMA9_9LEPT|nr:TIGR04452 family lipoprotein [Leptospira bandrabouensis]MCG6146224.1 TIGR04452 family lipoprotein [Leptospira bandrabouensis]MCG6153913.1 TIGR04452 family lipoprotein [Leptospira bandrabouensis]MCG6161361.1 TIGR04452 family lipoprotein [Leptospira bandrabouensis]MCG6165811.1 TIGR04452 family lipoprotein [Leptospira bandrabouensis]MCW7457937.1 TIGR04452 family lipoprotein [Leptospira bandrabouensis]